jgi:hypothetical protein
MIDVHDNDINKGNELQKHHEEEKNIDNEHDIDNEHQHQQQQQYHHYNPPTGPSFLPLLKVKEYDSKVNQIKLVKSSSKSKKKLESIIVNSKSNQQLSSSSSMYTDIEKSEIYESLGITQFFNGNYSEAIDNLKASVQPQYLRLKSNKRICYVKLLVRNMLMLMMMMTTPPTMMMMMMMISVMMATIVMMMYMIVMLVITYGGLLNISELNRKQLPDKFIGSDKIIGNYRRNLNSDIPIKFR